MNASKVIYLSDAAALITERCVIKPLSDGLTVTEVAPGVNVEKHVLQQAEIPLKVSPNLKVSDERLYQDAPLNLILNAKNGVS